MNTITRILLLLMRMHPHDVLFIIKLVANVYNPQGKDDDLPCRLWEDYILPSLSLWEDDVLPSLQENDNGVSTLRRVTMKNLKRVSHRLYRAIRFHQRTTPVLSYQPHHHRNVEKGDIRPSLEVLLMYPQMCQVSANRSKDVYYFVYVFHFVEMKLSRSALRQSCTNLICRCLTYTIFGERCRFGLYLSTLIIEMPMMNIVPAVSQHTNTLVWEELDEICRDISAQRKQLTQLLSKVRKCQKRIPQPNDDTCAVLEYNNQTASALSPPLNKKPHSPIAKIKKPRGGGLSKPFPLC